MFSKILLAAGLAMQATASTIRVDVGKSGLTFSPNTFNASAGDVLEFHFYAKNHSVVQGDFDNPCNPAPSAGFFSGFFPTNGTSQNVRKGPSVIVPGPSRANMYTSGQCLLRYS